MRWVGAVLGAALGIVVAIILYRAFSAPGSVVPPPAANNAQGVARTPIVAVPVTADEKMREDQQARRMPFYRGLRQSFANEILSFGVADEQDTLDVVLATEEPAHIAELVQQAFAPSAYDYGFRRVRFFVRNPAGSTNILRKVAETTRDETGNWNTFLK